MSKLFLDRLEDLGACSQAREWVGDKTLEVAWAECDRGDWMLWLAGRLRVDVKALTVAKCACARLALKCVPAGEERPRVAIETAEAWARGEATDEQRIAARCGATVAAYAYPYDAAADAAAVAADTSANAADVAAVTADACQAWASGLRECAELVRGIISAQAIAAALEVQ